MTTTANATTKLLRATPETVHWGYLDATIKPALTIDSGERVTIECATCNPEWMPAKDSGFDILPDIVEIHQKVKKGSGNHIFTGPIYVRGAAVGDVLEVKILDIEIRQNWGWNIFRGYMGTIPEDFPYTRIIHVPLDLKTTCRHDGLGLQDSARTVLRTIGGCSGGSLSGARTARSRASSAAISTVKN